MAKKSKRPARSNPGSPVHTPGSGRTFDREFNPDYSAVIKDLRRIGILAGSFFAILIALSFILN